MSSSAGEEAETFQLQRLQLLPVEGNNLQSGAISTVAFDTHQELLWIGNDCGRITSFYGPELTKYTSIRSHPPGEGPVIQFLFHEKGVISLASHSVHLCSRRGLTQWHISEISMTNLCCMSFLGKESSEILVAGCQNIMYKIDVERGQVMQEIPTIHKYTIMKHCHYICVATDTGWVNILDPDTLRIIKSWQAHTLSIHDMDAQNNYLVTCGWSSRPHGPSMLDMLAKVFDLRKLTQLTPIAFPGGAAFVQMHPKMNTTSIIASQSGQVQIVDLMNPNTTNIHQARLSTYMLSLTLAPSGDAWALTDQENTVHLWGSRKKMQFSNYRNPTEFADEPSPLPSISLNSDVPLSSIGMPHYREKLLSAWPDDHIYEVGRLPAKIDPGVMKSMLPAPIGHCATNPRKKLRNEADVTRLLPSNEITMVAPKFLSQKALNPVNDDNEERKTSDTVEAFVDVVLASSTKAEVPVMYRNVEIKYSKFGVDDFDFQYYNKTHYSGLETHITNSYLNPLLQLFKFTPMIRNLALHHTASNCTSEGCLLCEMGFLFDMLEKADGLSCQATNFLKAFGVIPEAARLGMLEDNLPSSSSLERKIQIANRFLLEQIAFDSKRVFANDMKVEQSIPPVLVFNAGLEKTSEGRQLWARPGWLPEEIGISAQEGGVTCYEGSQLSHRQSASREPIPVYELVGMVVDVNSGEHQKPHLVSLINVAISEKTLTRQNQWHLFNDFLVRETPTADALHFEPSWKMPVTLIYQIKSSRHAIDDSWKGCLDTRCLYYENSIPANASQSSHSSVVSLNPSTEAPRRGSPVAIDSEFVALRAEEIEISATGEREVIRPTRLGLARVSVLRGAGMLQAVPFIDDHIAIREPIVDYLTKYSGLKPGDLDASRSTHALVTLKVAYKKIWLLLNLGVVFVGHGLPSDFRTMNIHVPKAQVMDTVDLFYIRARARKLSLRFLAFYLLHEDIQQNTHDSVEDARTALRLWYKYKEFCDAKILNHILNEIYIEGRKFSYKPPSELPGGTAFAMARNPRGLEGGTATLGMEVGGNRTGRETPPNQIVSTGMSGPTTPVGRRATSKENDYFESPLR
ncbi:poly(A)-specific ribonuclease [Sticta canariensis]|nr:poly(A)-specific ribonuclease [Sticta canariensis]